MNTSWTFTIYGRVLGYRRPRDKPSKHIKYKDYIAYKEMVRVLARQSGFTMSGDGPQRKGVRYTLSVKVYWGGPAISDWSNVYKAIEDALFKADRYVIPASSQGLEWDTGFDDRVTVEIWEAMP